MQKKKEKESPSVQKLEIQRLGPDPEHNSTAHAHLLSSANVYAREAKWSTRIDIWGKVHKFILFQSWPWHFK